MRPAVNYSCCVFGHLTSQDGISIPGVIADGIEGAGTYAAAAALTLLGIDPGLLILVADGIGTAFLGTTLAALTFLFIYVGLAAVMLLHFSGTASAAHTYILNGTAETCHLMALEMVKGNEDVCIHNGTSYICFLKVFPIGNGNGDIVSSSKTVSYDDLAAGGNGIKTVDIGTVQMLQSVLSASGEQRITICQERKSSLVFDHISYCLGVVGA